MRIYWEQEGPVTLGVSASDLRRIQGALEGLACAAGSPTFRIAFHEARPVGVQQVSSVPGVYFVGKASGMIAARRLCGDQLEVAGGPDSLRYLASELGRMAGNDQAVPLRLVPETLVPWVAADSLPVVILREDS